MPVGAALELLTKSGLWSTLRWGGPCLSLSYRVVSLSVLCSKTVNSVPLGALVTEVVTAMVKLWLVLCAWHWSICP